MLELFISFPHSMFLFNHHVSMFPFCLYPKKALGCQLNKISFLISSHCGMDPIFELAGNQYQSQITLQ